ncbi:DUF6207 family protein [Streptomyces sp. NPDC002343]
MAGATGAPHAAATVPAPPAPGAAAPRTDAPPPGPGPPADRPAATRSTSSRLLPVANRQPGTRSPKITTLTSPPRGRRVRTGRSPNTPSARRIDFTFQEALAGRWATAPADRTTRTPGEPGVRPRCYLDLRRQLPDVVDTTAP